MQWIILGRLFLCQGYFINSVFMTTPFKIRVHEYFNHPFNKAFTNKAARNANDVGIIMLSGKFCNFFTPAHSSTDSLVFICGYGYTVSASTNQYSETGFTTFYGIRNGMCEIRIIDRVG